MICAGTELLISEQFREGERGEGKEGERGRGKGRQRGSRRGIGMGRRPSYPSKAQLPCLASFDLSNPSLHKSLTVISDLKYTPFFKD